ncbi:MAG TPA: hypothetical protein VHV77_07295, partial [Pirellulales bacterium]|nr:hypothetical protein [Pirellulales bacterium]
MTMGALARERCFQHAGREAIARCPECGRYFCRECITEHEDRIICASCLHQLGQRQEETGRGVRWLPALLEATGAGLGLVVAWISFYFLGSYL